MVRSLRQYAWVLADDDHRFPEYKPHDEKVSLWAESYGGHYGPRFMHCEASCLLFVVPRGLHRMLTS